MLERLKWMMIDFLIRKNVLAVARVRTADGRGQRRYRG